MFFCIFVFAQEENLKQKKQHKNAFESNALSHKIKLSTGRIWMENRNGCSGTGVR